MVLQTKDLDIAARLRSLKTEDLCKLLDFVGAGRSATALRSKPAEQGTTPVPNDP